MAQLAMALLGLFRQIERTYTLEWLCAPFAGWC